MQPQSSALTTGDNELTQVAQSSLDSEERHVFVVGPPRSGKSTRLPIIMAALSGKMVVCVQPEDWIARYYSEQIIAFPAAGAYNGKRVSVGYHMDEEKMELDFVPKHDVTYVSYRWLYRMVIDINYSEHSQLGFVETTRLNKGRKKTRRILRRKLGESIGFVILDEIHAESVIQELGYMAIHAATSGLVDAPIGFHKGTKVILATAYPESNCFTNRFGLSNEQIEQRTVKINAGFAPALGNEVQERYIPEDEDKKVEYHTHAVKRVKDIFRHNKEARILLLMDTMYSRRNIARQGVTSMGNVPVCDLETHEGRRLTQLRRSGSMVVLATPIFASRLPINGITDVICPSTQLFPVLSRKVHKEVFVDVWLDLWELSWAKNHLDPETKNTTIHYLFKPSVRTKLFEACGPRFRGGDYIDLTLGMIRLCREYVLGPQTPCRVQIPLSALDKALRQLAATHAIIEDDPANDISFQLVRKAHIAPMLELWDRCGLNRRHAYFLGLLERVAADAGIGASNQLLSRMLAVLMVVFDENPILRRSTPTEAPTKEFPELQHSLYLSERDFTGDAWVNAVVWMDTMRRARAAGTDVVSFARQYYKQRRTQVDAIPLEAAEHRLRMLARFLNINDHAQNEMCHGSFIPKIERLNQENRASYSGIIELLWDVYLHAYKYNLVYVMREEGSVKLFDFSSRFWIQHAWRHLAIDMDEQLGLAARRRQKGFYATGTSIEGLSLRSLTVMPLEVVHVLYGGKEEESGAFSIEVHLRLA